MSHTPGQARTTTIGSRAIDGLERAAELINSALDALSIAAISNPDLREDFARRCERLHLLMAEVEAARERTRVGSTVT